MDNWTVLTTMENDTEVCHENMYSYNQFFLIFFIGTPLALIGVFTNMLLLFLLCRQPNDKSVKDGEAVDIYFVVLVVLDVLICLLYLLLFSVDSIAEYYRLQFLWRMWLSYALALLVISRVTQLFSTYTIVIASWHRYCVVSRDGVESFDDRLAVSNSVLCCSNRCRCADESPRAVYGRLGATLALITCLRLPSYWDYSMVDRPECEQVDPFSTVAYLPLLMANDFYKSVYSFYLAHVVQVILPVLVLALFNGVIVYKLQRKLHMAKRLANMFLESRIRHQIQQRLRETRHLRSATYRLVAVVASYLVCNSAHLFLSVAEYVCRVPLLEDERGVPTDFYNYMTDVVSLMFMLNSFLRLYIHLAINDKMRQDFFDLLRSMFKNAPSPMSSSTVVEETML